MTSTSDHLEALRTRVAEELQTPVRKSVEWLARELAEIHGETVLGVLFYGSCLRKENDEGVLDFWVVVDRYGDAKTSRWHAMLNRVAAPNVYYLEREYEGAILRTKYGVINRKAFETGTSLNAWSPYVWARFAQPARALICRDQASQTFLTDSVTNAVITMLGRLVCALPARGESIRFSLSAFWQEAFRRTYDSERRPEAEERIRRLYLENEARYDAVAIDALHYLGEQGRFQEATTHPSSFSLTISRRDQQKSRFRWRLMRAYARLLGLARLLKTAFTFGDWVPYVLWKLERHTGRKIELSDRQRKHPLIFAWPIIIPLLAKRNLR